jgi:hypothetical protein
VFFDGGPGHNLGSGIFQMRNGADFAPPHKNRRQFGASDINRALFWCVLVALVIASPFSPP